MLNEFEGHLREAFVPPRMVSGGRIVSAIFRYWEEMPDTYPADVRGFLFKTCRTTYEMIIPSLSPHHEGINYV